MIERCTASDTVISAMTGGMVTFCLYAAKLLLIVSECALVNDLMVTASASNHSYVYVYGVSY
jgi:hypothetical protein